MAQDEIKVLKELASNREWPILMRLINNLVEQQQKAFFNFKNAEDSLEKRGMLKNAQYVKRIIQTLYAQELPTNTQQDNLNDGTSSYSSGRRDSEPESSFRFSSRY